MGSSSSKSSSSSSESSRKSDDRFTPEEKCSCGDEYLTAKHYHHCRTTLKRSEFISKCPLFRHHFVQVAYYCNNCSSTFNKLYDFDEDGFRSEFGRMKCLCEAGGHLIKIKYDEKPAYEKVEEAITNFNKTVGEYDIVDKNDMHYARNLIFILFAFKASKSDSEKQSIEKYRRFIIGPLDSSGNSTEAVMKTLGDGVHDMKHNENLCF